jgi:3-oxoadipate enol-lactonase
VAGEGPGVVVESMMPRLLPASTVQSRPDVAQAVERMMTGNDRQGIAAASRGMAERPDMTPLLPRIRCPVLVLVGQLDVISPPAEMRSIAAAIPGSRYAEIPGSGHMSPMEQPAQVNATILEFLTGLAVQR